MAAAMSHKSARIAERIGRFRGQEMDPHYLGYFDCFNQGDFYEAHDVLEELWLGCRREPDDGFYKGLIQFAGAFVHLQKGRLKPAAALFRLCSRYLAPYAPKHHRLSVQRVLELAEGWIAMLEGSDYAQNPLDTHAPPTLALEPGR